jgi:murein L,D-transpeptidase YcbB/YkuD
LRKVIGSATSLPLILYPLKITVMQLKFTRTYTHWLILLIFGCLSLYLFSCKSGKSRPREITTAITDTIAMISAPNPIYFDSVALEIFLKEHKNLASYAKAYRDFYAKRQFQYVWYNDSGITETAYGLVAQSLNNLDSNKAFLPYRHQLDSLMNNRNIEGNQHYIPNVDAELHLTGLYFYYAEKVLLGVDASVSSKLGWLIPRKKVSMVALLDSFLLAKDWDSFERNSLNSQYFPLKDALKKYKELGAAGNEVLIPAAEGSAGKLKPGMESPVVGPLRKRLTQLGYAGPLKDTSAYLPDMIAAVNKAKRAYGLKEDSVADKGLINELNVPSVSRSKQLLVNMERFRWVPSKFESNELIVVNIPEFKLHYYIQGMPEWSCNVVVGAPVHKTVIFSGVMDYVVFSPYWYVPQSIIKNEIGLSRAKSPAYLKRKNMEWSGGSLREKPGPTNSLGLVKFIFPNSNSIYLHDTPSKSLFNEDSRAFSHGCIRVAKPFDLAKKVLAYDSSWTDEKINAAMHAGSEKRVVLARKIPVYIGYFTAFSDQQGLVHFRKDVYNRDGKLMEMLAGSGQ